MPQPPAKQFSGIFISYRRDDASGHAGRLCDRLGAHFGNDQIFMDIDHIALGEDFVQVLENALRSCEILIAIIGRQWLSSAGDSSRRLDNPNDFVHLEIVAALNRDIRVIPVLVQGATMPKPQDLPNDLSKLARRQGLELTDLRWQRDVDQLIGDLEKILAKLKEERNRNAQEEAERQRVADARQQAIEQERLKKKAAEAELKRREAQEAERRRKEKELLEQEAAAAELKRREAQERRDTEEKELLKQKAAEAELKWREAQETDRRRKKADDLERSLGVGRAPEFHQKTQPAAPLEKPTPNTEAVKHPSAQGTFKNQIGIELVWIPPGSFMMGSESYPSTPVHRVTIREGFYMGKHEVTQAQWGKLMVDNPSYFKGDDLPVEHVSWSNLQDFISKLNAMNDQYQYRLPSEAEWEYACRAGTTADYPADLDALVWHSRNSSGKTHPVGTKQPNAFGLYDMLGNVSEWCEDWWRSSYVGAPVDGTAWTGRWLSTKKWMRVTRGLSWIELPVHQRFSHRFWQSTVDREPGEQNELDKYICVGLRVVAVART